MAMSDGDARSRLQQAAVELFGERGFDQVTAAQIAARAGVTERTFFRHFPDKREVLFQGQAVLADALLTSIRDAPDELGPVATLFRAFRSVRPILEGNRPFAKPLHEVITVTPALRERELAKLDTLSGLMADALRARSVPPLRATLAARAGIAAFAEATIAWLDEDGLDLARQFDIAEQELKAGITDV